MLRTRSPWWLATIASLAACTPARAPGETVMKPLEERRARGILVRVIENSGKPVKPGRTFTMAEGFKLVEDARIGGTPYGIAYITGEEREAAGEQLPKYDPESALLRILRPADGAIVLVLHDLAYKFDARGDDDATSVTAEKTFERDVGDFLENVVATGAGQDKPRKSTPPASEEPAAKPTPTPGVDDANDGSPSP